jgi:hypothetical protein
MKSRLAPVYFPAGPDPEFHSQLAVLQQLLANEAEFLDPVPLGSELPEADAALFPQVLGEAYRHASAFQSLKIPVLIVTSEFGTLSMWDWEIAGYLRNLGVPTITPYSLEQTKKICRALGVRRELKQTKFLVYQDNPGEGQQASIFKRFYWWEDECTQRMLDKFGVRIVKSSFRELGKTAREIADCETDDARERWTNGNFALPQKSLQSALKLYLAVKRDLDADPDIRAVGMNCLNESHYSDTTPCLAWDILYQERRMIWGCEGDTVSMLTKYVLHQCLDAPIIMTNLYPFVLGQAALKHERIHSFPSVREPENCILIAHCGYMGVIPRPFATEWSLKPKVLAIVDNNASAIDALLPEGDITLAKFDSSFERMIVVEGQLEGYAQYPESDCRNGGILRVPDGPRLVNSLTSHHTLLMVGHHASAIETLGTIFNFKVDRLN